MTKILDIVVGLPGSGKSTYIRTSILMAYPAAKVVSTDAIIEELCEKNGLTYSQGFTLYINEATKLYNAALNIFLKNGDHIIVDRTNLTVASRRKILSRVPKEYMTRAIVVETPAKEEWIRRLASRPGKMIPPCVLENMAKTYEKPTLEEGYDEIYYA